jgi:hypothetical protein
LECPVDRALPELAVLLVAVGAAAVVEVAGDGVVVVAVDRGDAAPLDQGANLVRVRPVADQIAAAVDGVNTSPLDRQSTASRAGRLAWMSVMTAARFTGRTV